MGSGGALLAGLIASLGFGLPLPPWLATLGKTSLQASVVVLGFSLDPAAAYRAGTRGLSVTAFSLSVTLGVGFLLTRWLGVDPILGTLIASGTAICGGSAIAAVGQAIHADRQQMSVALAVVFLLNAVALFLFPQLGHAMGLSPESFGWLSALAIHDTSSVVGAAERFADAAVPTAVTVKLARVLWIVPLAALAPLVFSRRKGTRRFPRPPGFLLLFLGAVGLRALVGESAAGLAVAAALAGKGLLKGAIFLLGAQMTREGLAKASSRAMALGVLLWALSTAVALILLHFV